jgi:hypothetical protein
MQAESSVVVELFGREVVCIKAIMDVGNRPIEHEQN